MQQQNTLPALNEAEKSLRRCIRRAGQQAALPQRFSYCDVTPDPPTSNQVSIQSCKKLWEADSASLVSLIAPHGNHSASSTDDPTQMIHNLCHDDATFWSSDSGSPTEGATLLFQLRSPCSLVSYVSMSIYRACYQHGEPLYPPEKLSIWLGSSPGSLTQVSPIYSVDKTDRSQTFAVKPQRALSSLSLGVGYMQIKLYGRCQIQREDLRHYLAIRHVAAFGQEVSPHETASLMRRLSIPLLSSNQTQSSGHGSSSRGVFASGQAGGDRKALAANFISSLSGSLSRDLCCQLEQRKRELASSGIISHCFSDITHRNLPLTNLLSLHEHSHPFVNLCHPDNLSYILAMSIQMDFQSFVQQHGLITRVSAFREAICARKELEIEPSNTGTDLRAFSSLLDEVPTASQPLGSDSVPMETMEEDDDDEEEEEEEEEEERSEDHRAPLMRLMREVVNAGMREEREEEMRWRVAERAFEIMQRRARTRGVIRQDEDQDEEEGQRVMGRQQEVDQGRTAENRHQRPGEWCSRPLPFILGWDCRLFNGSKPLFLSSPRRTVSQAVSNGGFTWLVDELDTWHYIQP